METINFGEEQNNSAPKAPNNRKKKLIWAGIILAALILSVIGWQYWQYIQSPYYQQMKAAKTLEKLYADDTIGGKTPEETLALFLDAVRKEDFDLASQYAVYDLRKNIKSDLTNIKTSGKINEFVSDLPKLSKENSNLGPDYVNFFLYENGKRVLGILMGKSNNNVWKITEF